MYAPNTFMQSNTFTVGFEQFFFDCLLKHALSFVFILISNIVKHDLVQIWNCSNICIRFDQFQQFHFYFEGKPNIPQLWLSSHMS